MKLSITGKLYLGFLSAVIITLLIGVVTYQSIQTQQENAQWVRHSYQVINQVDDVKNILVDMETGRRGFRATNQKRFLEPYNTGLLHIAPSINDLKTLVKDNPGQLNNVQGLEDKVLDLIQLWRLFGQDASGYTIDSIIRMTDAEKTKMDVIRKDINHVINTEIDLRIQREKINESSLRFTSNISIIGTTAVLIIILILIYFIISEFNNRKKAEAAVKENLLEVKILNDESNNKNWLLTGVADVNASIQDKDDIISLTKSSLSTISEYINATASAMYVYKEDEHELILQASNALPANAQKSFKLNEGLIGQAAGSREAIITKQVPAGYWSVQSASGSATAGEVICIPLWYNRELKGVLEFATFGEFSSLQVDFLNSIAYNLATALNGADAREKVMILLEQVQLQKLDLQNQQEELRQTNEELTRQAEVLQASEEELRVQEEELRQINAELEEKNEAVEMSRQALSQKASELEITGKYKSEFLANMSHELRTPLNSVLILAKILSENKQANLSGKQIEYANIIHKSGTDLLNLINDILDLSKIEAGKIDFNFEEVKVDSVIRDISQTFHVLSEEKNIAFKQNKEDQLSDNIYTDKQRLEQVIKNLLSNAFKFTPANGTITLSFKTSENTANLNNDLLRNAKKVLVIEVKDTGIGIPMEKQQLIFEAFQQADGSTSRKYGGTGLGLSISKELVKKLGGEIKLESKENVGSTFSLYLPLDKSSFAEKNPAETEVVASPESDYELTEIVEQTKINDDRKNITASDKTMLIVEDDPQFAYIVQDFARSRGYKTIVALQGDEGLYYARKYRPSAITLDIQLPVIDGWTLLKLLKSDEKLKKIPVHVISATDVDKSGGAALAFIKKPVEKDDLEKAFNLINRNIHSDLKKILLLASNNDIDTFMKKVFKEKHADIEYDVVGTEAEAIVKIQETKYDCIIVDMGHQLEKGKKELKNIHATAKSNDTPIIIYLDEDLSSKDEVQLKRLSDVIIRDSSQSKDRLMDELELFLYKVQEVENAPFPKASFASNLNNETTLQNRKVLLADDDMRNVFALTTLLEENDMQVITANDGKEALALLQENPDIDIILMDIMMPEMDGYEATKLIRANKKYSHIPVIALTAKAMQGDREKTLEAGASDYITKPVDNARLLSLMRVWLTT
jgi:signal transduction histidine kinase/DNA-binding response OmpR family regulator/CHASE3 domain sensor protein